jgi:hypothetical protein
MSISLYTATVPVFKQMLLVVLLPGTPKEKTLTVEDYALRYDMPQFFFHVTTA